MSVQRRAFGNLKNNFTPIVPLQSKNLNSNQGNDFSFKQKLNLNTPLKTEIFAKPTRPNSAINDPDLRFTYLPFKDNFEDVVFDERLRMENFEPLKEDDFSYIKKENIKKTKSEGSEMDDDYDSSSSNIFADLEAKEFRIFSQKSFTKKSKN